MNINISYCVDHNYAFLLAASITSILINSKEEDNITFYVLDNGLTEEDKKRIYVLEKIKNFSIQFKTIDAKILNGCKIERRSKINIYNTISVYGRLFIANIFDSIDKILYLDVDTIVEKSLEELYSTELEGKLFGACTDVDNIPQSIRLELFHGSYFNSGVLLIDCVQWRNKKILNKIIQFLKDYKEELRWPDQDLLNIMFSHESVYLLKTEYNYPAFSNEPLDPTIIHFMGRGKFDTKYSNMLINYIEKTPWKSEIKNIVLRHKSNRKKIIKKQIYNLIKVCIGILLKNKILNKNVMKFVNYYLKYYTYQNNISDKYTNGMLNYIFKDRKIKNGPFNGMYYNIDTDKNAFQKLLGSYEKEIHSIVEYLISLEPKYVINIGTKDGYYSVGMSFKLQNSKILVFEKNNNYISLCCALAQKNNTLERIEINRNFKTDILQKISNVPGEKIVFICNCSGFEQKYLNRELFFNLKNSYFIVKINDNLYHNIQMSLINSFKETHNYKIIYSISDNDRIYQYSFKEINYLSLSEKFILLSENGNKQGKWFFIYPKNETDLNKKL